MKEWKEKKQFIWIKKTNVLFILELTHAATIENTKKESAWF